MSHREYLTHHNGRRPYKVILNNSSNEIIIINEVNGLKLLSLKPDKIWIGKSPLTQMTEFSGGYGERFNGNSILVRYNENYIFIGHNIFTFTTNHDIVKYVSEVGNSDVPYPYAIDIKNNYYLMLENTILPVPLKYSLDPYNYYYNINKKTYQSIINVSKFIAEYNGKIEEYNVDYNENPKEHYHRKWMKNLHAVNKKTGEIYPVLEKSYIEMMEKIAKTYQYKSINNKIIHDTNF
jgi:hypothetical protein